MNPVVLFAIAFGAIVVWLVIQSMRAGPNQLDEMALARGIAVRKATTDDSGDAWTRLGSRTMADGLRLKFDHDDDPEAEASFVIEDRTRTNSLAQRKTVRLTGDFETHHVHTRGYVFRVRVRGTGAVVGKEIRIQMHVHGDGKPYCGRVENDDDIEAAVGDWIEFESVEVLEVAPR